MPLQHFLTFSTATESVLQIQSAVCGNESADNVFDGNYRRHYVLQSNKWLEVTLSKSENVSSLWLLSFKYKPTLTIEWANATTQSTLNYRRTLIPLQGGQTTSKIKIKSNKRFEIGELILFGWRRSEMIDFVVILFFFLFSMFQMRISWIVSSSNLNQLNVACRQVVGRLRQVQSINLLQLIHIALASGKEN